MSFYIPLQHTKFWRSGGRLAPGLGVLSSLGGVGGGGGVGGCINPWIKLNLLVESEQVRKT